MRFFCLLVLAFLFIISLTAQDKSNFEFSIDSKTFGKERKISVFLPDRYLQNPNDSFGVVVMLDAQSSSVWNMAKGNINYLVNQYQIMPLIVVGIHTESRQKEFLPEDNREKTHPSNKDGTALFLLQHLAEEVRPLIEKNYRTNGFNALIGHSRAGYFVAHTLFSEYSHLFNAYLMISPGLHYLDEKVMIDCDQILKSKANFHKFVYTSVGTLGSTDHFFKPYVEKLDSIIEANPNSTLRWKKEILEGYNHFNSVIPGINNGLVEMSRNYMLMDYHLEKFAELENMSIQKEIEGHYKKNRLDLGFAVPTNSNDIRYYGNEFREMGKENLANELYKYALILNPKDFRVYRTLGWASMNKGENEKAIQHFQKALELLADDKGTYDTETYERMKSGIERSISEVEAR